MRERWYGKADKHTAWCTCVECHRKRRPNSEDPAASAAADPRLKEIIARLDRGETISYPASDPAPQTEAVNPEPPSTRQAESHRKGWLRRTLGL